MPIFFDEIDVELEKKLTIFPYRDIPDDKWPMTLDGKGEEIPAVPYGWREVGFLVERPDLPKIKFVEAKSAKLRAIKGMDRPYRDFDPAFIEHVCGVKGKKSLIEGWVGIDTKDTETGKAAPKPYDPQWLYERMMKGTFLYVEFMNTYGKLMETVKAEEQEADQKAENF